MTEREALKLSLECAERCESIDGMYSWSDTITAIKESLAQPEQEPVAWRVFPPYEDSDGYFDFTDSKDTAETLQQRGWKIVPLYTTPPDVATPRQRTWVGLTKQEAEQLVEDCDWYNDPVSFCFDVEAKLKEKNSYAEENT